MNIKSWFRKINIFEQHITIRDYRTSKDSDENLIAIHFENLNPLMGDVNFQINDLSIKDLKSIASMINEAIKKCESRFK